MREPDLVPLVARCFQNFMDVENHDPNTCYVPPSLETLDERAKQSYLNDALFHRKVDTIVYVVSEHITSLRAQVAELQRDHAQAIYALEQSETSYSELQRQLDEAAKQEPVGWWHEGETPEESDYFPASDFPHYGGGGKPLYAKPINLPALIEQAKAEEREECAARVQALSGSKWVSPEAAGECVDAIRARKP